MTVGIDTVLQPLALPLAPARALLACPDGSLYCGHHGEICHSPDGGRNWTMPCVVPSPPTRRIAQISRLACRLLRHEVRAAQVLSDGTIVAATRCGVWFAAPGERRMRPSLVESLGGRPAKPPMTLTLGPGDQVLWGEYNSEYKHGLSVNIYASEDRGRTFRVALSLEAGSTLHVHNLLLDATGDAYWVFTGDFDDEPGIGRLTRDLTRFEWVAKGRQEYRVVEAFDFGDSLVYATDTHLEPNAVIRFHKADGHTERLQELEGSCIYACRVGEWLVVSTTVEPSPINTSCHAAIWVSRDGERWRRVYQAEKDGWNGRYFQFGSIVLPRGAGAGDTLLFSGQALKGIDGRAFVADLSAGAQGNSP